MGHTKSHMKMKCKARGGGAMAGRTDYTASNNVAKEAAEKKGGGAVHGHKGKHRVKKARGGGIGSDKSPFTSAAAGGMGDMPGERGVGLAKGSDFTAAHRGK